MKTYTLVKSGRRNAEIKGTLAELNDYFGFNCKSVTAIVNKAQRQYSEREAACYDRTFINLKKDEKAVA